MDIPSFNPSSACWWLGINNTSKRRNKEVVLYSEIQPFIIRDRPEFRWECRGHTEGLYGDMEKGDNVILWMAHGDFEPWGITGLARVQDPRPAWGKPSSRVLGELYFGVSRVITPYPKQGGQVERPIPKTPETDWLLQVFGPDFEALKDVYCMVGDRLTKARPVTVDIVLPRQFMSVLEQMTV